MIVLRLCLLCKFSHKKSYDVQLLAYYLAMLRRARYCYVKLSVRPSVCNVEILRSHKLE